MKVEYAPAASKQFSRLNKPIQSRIKKYMGEIALLDNPRSRGKALTSNLSGLWRYRVDNYRILCRINDDRLIITVIEIGHRSTVYR
ncbi:type II toxin-antitoxin system RelE/ParE family toxin [Treponema denticola]|uniref:type II toxin-antitoxin system RelE family toxin n=1 Tax=Treponema denticola TaxID=158 RepID=UPI0002B59941|nr:type II toxin-antitoxin system RelE/ParE family toxin [Treponema denticola]EMB41960.1 RelE/StbE family addiction module toxin [Treponema denticola ATCC 33520]